MSDATLTAAPRSADQLGSRPAGRLRREGQVPAVVYGLGAEATAVSVPARELNRILHSDTGANTLITLALGGEEHLALARQIVRNPTKGDLVHVDFVKIRRDEAVQADVPVHLTGESVGQKDGGILEQQTVVVTIEAKPEDIPTVIEHDISALELAGNLKAGELTMPAGVTLVTDPEETIAIIAVPRGLAAAAAGEGEGAEGEAAAAE